MYYEKRLATIGKSASEGGRKAIRIQSEKLMNKLFYSQNSLEKSKK